MAGMCLWILTLLLLHVLKQLIYTSEQRHTIILYEMLALCWSVWPVHTVDCQKLEKKIHIKYDKFYSPFIILSMWQFLYILHNSMQWNCFVPQWVSHLKPANTDRIIEVVMNRDKNVDTLRKKSANEPVRFGLFAVAAAALFAAVTKDSLASDAFFGLDWPICIGINIWQPTNNSHFPTMLQVTYMLKSHIKYDQLYSP